MGGMTEQDYLEFASEFLEGESLGHQLERLGLYNDDFIWYLAENYGFDSDLCIACGEYVLLNRIPANGTCEGLYCQEGIEVWLSFPTAFVDTQLLDISKEVDFSGRAGD